MDLHMHRLNIHIGFLHKHSPQSHYEFNKGKNHHLLKPGTEQVEALAGISRSAICCHSNETHAPIANPPNSAQLEGIPYHSPKLHLGPCCSVGMRRGTDTQTQRRP